MTEEELKPIDTSKYKITETGQVLKMTKDRMNLNDYETTLNGQPVVYSDPIDSLFPDTRSKNQKKKDRKEYFKRKRKMRGSFTIEVKTKGLRLERHYTTKGDRRK